MCQPRHIRIEVNNWKRESNSVLDYFVLFWSFHLKFHFNLNIWCRLKENISLCRRKVDIVNSTNVNLNTATGRLYGITNVGKLTHNQFCDKKMVSTMGGLEEKANAIIKNGGPAEFIDIKNAIWKWLCITREANVTVKAPMIQEKAR